MTREQLRLLWILCDPPAKEAATDTIAWRLV
jgi:hypothetical protein